MKQILKNKMARKNIKTMGVKGYKTATRKLNKLQLLDKVSQNGKIFGVEFTKKDGTVRVMSCRKGVKKYLKGGFNTVSHLPQYVTVLDCNKKAYRNINLDTMTTLKGCGEVYNF